MHNHILYRLVDTNLQEQQALSAVNISQTRQTDLTCGMCSVKWTFLWQMCLWHWQGSCSWYFQIPVLECFNCTRVWIVTPHVHLLINTLVLTSLAEAPIWTVVWTLCSRWVICPQFSFFIHSKTFSFNLICFFFFFSMFFHSL